MHEGPKKSRSDDEEILWRKYLIAGELFATKVPHRITTVLGSCVAVCLWDSKLKAGGMNHFILAKTRDGDDVSTRFGDVATLSLIMRMEALGSRRANLRAKVYGGGHVLGSQMDKFSAVGKNNILIARKVLHDARIPIESEHVGNYHGRKLHFNTFTGDITVGMVDALGKSKTQLSSSGGRRPMMAMAQRDIEK